MRRSAPIGLVALVLASQPFVGPARAQDARAAAVTQTEAATGQLHAYLDAVGYEQLEARRALVARIDSRAAARQRQAQVRQRVVDLVGGIPATTGPVTVRRFGGAAESGFIIENIAYESAPGFWVTANVYVPNGRGPFPALVMAPGHGAGKSSNFSPAASFAGAGVLVLSIDPLGQGERLQHFDPELGASKVEPSGEHEHANQTALLVGQHIARYWFADGIRGVDYLVGRDDVDAARIGTFGCSGGGTAAAYLAAIEPRIRVAAVASFITSFEHLLPGNGPQDAEQTLPGFIAEGLDFADWIELAAPRAYAVAAFEDDFFPVTGADDTVAEAGRFYDLFAAGERLRYVRGRGGHCNLGPVMPELAAFLFEHLGLNPDGVPDFPRRVPRDPDALVVLPTGQLSTSIGGRTAEDFARERLARDGHEASVRRTQADIEALRSELREAIGALGAGTATLAAPRASVTRRWQDGGMRLATHAIEMEPGVTLEAVTAVQGGNGRRPIVLWLDPAPMGDVATSARFRQLAADGNLVVAFHPRGVLGEPPEDRDALALGHYMPEFLRATVSGRTLVGMRADDIRRLLDWVETLDDAMGDSVRVYAVGGLGMSALHAAVLDTRVHELVMEGTLLTYRTALEAGLHRNLSELVIPGVLLRYDVPDLLQALSPRRVTLVNPADAVGQPMLLRRAAEALEVVTETDARLGVPGRVRLVRRGPRDPIPLD